PNDRNVRATKTETPVALCIRCTPAERTSSSPDDVRSCPLRPDSRQPCNVRPQVGQGSRFNAKTLRGKDARQASYGSLLPQGSPGSRTGATLRQRSDFLNHKGHKGHKEIKKQELR